MSQYVRNMDTNQASPPIGRDTARADRERTPQVREQLDYLTKAAEILDSDAQQLLARIAPAQREEPSKPEQSKDGRCEMKISAPVAKEISAVIARLEFISAQLREACDLLEL